MENKVLTFDYGIDNKRFKTEYIEDNTRKNTRYYFDTYEKEIQEDGNVRHLNYIYAGGGLVAIYEQKTTGDAMHYVYTDYLGSLRCITDANGNVEERLGFDAWGNRRDPITGESSVSLPSYGGVEAGRGYTGHEHLYEFGLINMNARIYDPMLGMFISPDKYIQSANNTQNYNRYSYCLNNPLMYTEDPSGNYFFVIPGISWTPQGGLDVSLSFGVGIPQGLSAQLTIGYEFRSNNLYGTVGVSYCGFTAYAGYGTESGWMAGVGFGFGSAHGFSSNMTYIGFSYSQYGGWGAHVSSYHFSDEGVVMSSSINYSHTYYVNDPNSAKNRAERRNRAAIEAAFERHEAEHAVQSTENTREDISPLSSRSLNNISNDEPGLVGYTITMNRIAESNDATVSTFTLVTPNGMLTGYFLEPGGPSTTTRNMDRRIPAGTYDVIPYSSAAHPDVYTLYNGDVPADRHILIHIGNYHNNTEGCLLPGSSYSMYSSNYAVWNSTATFNSFHSLLGTHYAVLIVNDMP